MSERTLFRASLGLGILWVFFLWRFWSLGILALGINATVFLAAVGCLLFLNVHRKLSLIVTEWKWVIPLSLIAVGYSLFENPFIKLVNLYVIPIVWIVFMRQSTFSKDKLTSWSPTLFTETIGSFLTIPSLLIQAVCMLLRCFNWRPTLIFCKSRLVLRVISGFGVLAAISIFVVIPLLATADEGFAAEVLNLRDCTFRLVADIANGPIFWKTLSVGIVSVVVLVCALVTQHSLQRPLPAEAREIDSVVSGIVITGLLLVYFVFIRVQIKGIWFEELPLNFDVSEKIAKGGFWQLVALSIINLLLFWWCYRRTTKVVQRILLAFTLACTAIVFSAAHKMYQYVSTYGLSYEKFYASYTVLYCAIIFLSLILAMLLKTRLEVLKVSSFLFLWMFSISNILPVEQIIFRVDLHLAQAGHTHVQMDDLTMLSADVLSVAADASSKPAASRFFARPRWEVWMKYQKDYLNSKRFYEMNLADLYN